MNIYSKTTRDLHKIDYRYYILEAVTLMIRLSHRRFQAEHFQHETISDRHTGHSFHPHVKLSAPSNLIIIGFETTCIIRIPRSIPCCILQHCTKHFFRPRNKTLPIRTVMALGNQEAPTSRTATCSQRGFWQIIRIGFFFCDDICDDTDDYYIIIIGQENLINIG